MRLFNWLRRKREPIKPVAGLECWQATPHVPVAAMMDLIMRSPPCLWPMQAVEGYGAWQDWPNVRAAHQELMRGFLQSLRPYPQEEYGGRGIVICNGGWRFFPSTYVTVRMIRHQGCRLPIELWYLGKLNEYDDKMGWILRDYGPVVWRDANAVAHEKGQEPRYLGSQADGYPPWEIKAYAVLHSSFSEVLSLDADSYPTRNPEHLFDHPKYKASTAAFWPDGAKIGNVPDSVWDAFGMPRIHAPQWESGQFVVNKAKAWKAINLAWWLNEHRDYCYRIPGLYGDKETFHVAWRFTGTPFVHPWGPPAVLKDMYLQLGFDGQPEFVHRTHNKWKLGTEPGGFKSGQGKTTRIEKNAPNESIVQGWMKELDQLVNPGNRRNFRLRPGTSDEAMWDECVVRNDYQLPVRFEPGTVVLDIGANIGAFVHAALMRGAEFVYAVEPAPDNLATLQRNVRQWRDRIRLFYGAAWRSDKRERRAAITKLNTHESWETATANWTVAGIDYEGKRTTGEQVSLIRFDTLVKAAWKRSGKPIVLKIDCEGGEFPILSTSKELSKIGSVYGECHRAKWDGKQWTQADIRRILDAAGFTVKIADENIRNTLFWATRDRIE